MLSLRSAGKRPADPTARCLTSNGRPPSATAQCAATQTEAPQVSAWRCPRPDGTGHPGRRRFARYGSLGGRRMEGPKPARCPSQRAIRFPNRCTPQSSPIAEYGVPEGAGLRNLGSRRIVSLGSHGTAGWRRPARSWWRWLRGGPGSATTRCSRCCGGSSGAVPGWLSGRAGPGVFMGARAWVLGARGRSPSCWPPGGPGRVGREAAGG